MGCKRTVQAISLDGRDADIDQLGGFDFIQERVLELRLRSAGHVGGPFAVVAITAELTRRAYCSTPQGFTPVMAIIGVFCFASGFSRFGFPSRAFSPYVCVLRSGDRPQHQAWSRYRSAHLGGDYRAMSLRCFLPSLLRTLREMAALALASLDIGLVGRDVGFDVRCRQERQLLARDAKFVLLDVGCRLGSGHAAGLDLPFPAKCTTSPSRLLASRCRCSSRCEYRRVVCSDR